MKKISACIKFGDRHYILTLLLIPSLNPNPNPNLNPNWLYMVSLERTSKDRITPFIVMFYYIYRSLRDNEVGLICKLHNYSDITPHEFWKVWLQEQETLLNEIHGNVAYNVEFRYKSCQVFIQSLDNVWHTLRLGFTVYMRQLIMRCDVISCVICKSTNLNIS